MKLLLFSFLLVLLVSGLSFGQVSLTLGSANAGPLQTGFAVVTPVAGIGEGLSVSETFGEQINANMFQASVLGSPLVTLTDVVVNVNPNAGMNTGIALVNPNAGPATVTFSLSNAQGVMLSTRTLTVGAHQQISRFVTELFLGDPNMNQALTGLLFINSDQPLGVVALAFNGATFTSLPVAAQLSASNVLMPAITTTAPSTTTTIPVTTFSPVTPTFSGVPTPPTLLPPPVVTIPPTINPITGSASSLVTSTSAIPTFATTPSSAVTQALGFVFPQLTVGVGGTGALLLPQVATGGGWVSQIMIANPTQFAQTVRVDFFNAFGAPLPVPSGSTVPSITIPPGGVATLTL